MRRRSRVSARLGAWLILGSSAGGCFVDAPAATSAAATTTESTTTSATDDAGSTTTTSGATTTTTTTAAESTSSTAAESTADLTTTGCPPSTFYADADADSYGDPRAPIGACEAPSGHVADASDCDDNDDKVHPDAPEICDAIDNDCDDLIDEWSPQNLTCGGCDMMLVGASVFHRCPAPLAWAPARVACQGRGGDLAILNTAAKNTAIAAWVAGDSKSWWFGLSDQFVEGDFRWVDDSALVFATWGAGEPNNSGGSEDCGQLYAKSGLWNDAGCTGNQPYLCESPAPP